MRAFLFHTGLRPVPPRALRGDPIAPLRAREARTCAPSFSTRGCAPYPRGRYAGTPSPHSALARRARARLPFPHGAAPRTPAGATRGPHRPTPRSRGAHVRAFLFHTGLRPVPPRALRGDPIAPLRAREARTCAPSFSTRGCAPYPRGRYAGTPSPHSALARRARARLPFPHGAAPRTPAGATRGPHRPTPRSRGAHVRAFLFHTGLRPVPPRALRGDPIAPLRAREARTCAPSFSTRGCAPYPRGRYAGTPSPHSALARRARARLPFPHGAAPRTPAGATRPHRPTPRSRGAHVRAFLFHTGLRPVPPRALRGDPIAPLRAREARTCAPSFSTRGCAPYPRGRYAGTPSPHSALARRARARLPFPHGAAPRTPAGATRGPHRPTPRSRGAHVRAWHVRPRNWGQITILLD